MLIKHGLSFPQLIKLNILYLAVHLHLEAVVILRLTLKAYLSLMITQSLALTRLRTLLELPLTGSSESEIPGVLTITITAEIGMTMIQ
jgi:hypothetical protein